jgi:flagellar hook-associated protein 3 FlgL
MRITSTRIIEQQAANAATAETNVSQISQEASSGLRVTSPSQDPASWLAAHRATLHDTLSKGVGTAAQYGTDVLDQTDSSLASLSSILSQVQSLALQGSNATLNADNRAELATEVAGYMKSAVAAANAQAPNGEYLLAGSKSLTAPFADDGTYTGDDKTRAILTTEGGSTETSTIAGSALTASNGVDVLPLLQKVATALAANDVTGLQGTLSDLTTAQTQVSSLRTRAGAAMAALNSADSARQDLQLHLETSASNYVEADAVSVATQLAQASTALQTNQAISAHVISILTQSSNS